MYSHISIVAGFAFKFITTFYILLPKTDSPLSPQRLVFTTSVPTIFITSSLTCFTAQTLLGISQGRSLTIQICPLISGNKVWITSGGSVDEGNHLRCRLITLPCAHKYGLTMCRGICLFLAAYFCFVHCFFVSRVQIYLLCFHFTRFAFISCTVT